MNFEAIIPHALDWMTATIVAIAFILGSLHYSKAISFKELLRLPHFTAKWNRREEKKTNMTDIWLDICFFLIISLLFAQLLLMERPVIYFSDWTLLLRILLGLAIYLITQRFVHSLHGYLTKTTSFFNSYNIYRLKYLQWSSFLVLPILILSIYLPFGTLFFAWLAFGLFMAVYVFSFFQLASFGSRITGHFLYHLIFYLCAVEILPLILLYKTLI